MANALFEPFFASLRSNRISFTNCLEVCTDGATRNPKEDQWGQGQDFARASFHTKLGKPLPRKRPIPEEQWTASVESRDQLQLEDGAADQERCFDDGGAPSKVHKRMWNHRWEYTAFSLSKGWQHSNTMWESQSAATDLSTSNMADRGPANRKDRLTGMCIIRRGNWRWGQINNHGDGQADRHRYE